MLRREGSILKHLSLEYHSILHLNVFIGKIRDRFAIQPRLTSQLVILLPEHSECCVADAPPLLDAPHLPSLCAAV